jgi:hypothetical protein
MAANSYSACFLAKIGGYFFALSAVANFPIGYRVTSPRICENKVEEILQGILPFLMASFFLASTSGV